MGVRIVPAVTGAPRPLTEYLHRLLDFRRSLKSGLPGTSIFSGPGPRFFIFASPDPVPGFEVPVQSRSLIFYFRRSGPGPENLGTLKFNFSTFLKKDTLDPIVLRPCFGIYDVPWRPKTFSFSKRKTISPFNNKRYFFTKNLLRSP